MTHVTERVASPRKHRYRRPITGALAIALMGGSFALATPVATAADPVVAANGWSYTKDTYDTGVRNGYQLALDAANRKVYFSDAAWSTQTRTVADNGDGTYTYGETVFNVGSGKLSVFDAATRAREADHSFLGLTRNDGNGKEDEPFSWANASATATSINSMRTTFSPYGVAVDGTTPGGATIITTTARQRSATAGYGGGVVVYSASQGAPTDADRVFEFSDGTPVLQGPRRIAVNTVTHKAYVTSLGTQRNNGPDAGYITEIDLITRQVTARIAVPGGVGAVGVAVDEVNNRIYTGAMAASKLYVIDGNLIDRSDAKSFAINEAAVTELAADLDANQRPTYNAELKRLYVSTYASPEGKVYVVDADPASAGYGTIIDTIVTGPTNAVEVDGQRGLIYSANLGDQNVAVFDAETHEQLLTLPTSANAVNIGIDPVSRDVWVSNFSNSAKVDVFSISEPLEHSGTEYTLEGGETYYVAESIEAGDPIRISGKGWKNTAGDAGSIIAIKLDDGAVSTKLEVKHPVTGVVQGNKTIYGIAQANADGEWAVELPWPTLENSDAEFKPGETHAVRLLTGSLLTGDKPRTAAASFTVTGTTPQPVQDQAAVTVPAEWVEGEPLTIGGTGWTWADGTTGSTIGIKLNGGSLVPLGDPYGDEADNVYAIIKAADDSGDFTVALPFPGEGAVQPGNTPVKAGDEITVHFLTGSLAPGDRVRSVSKTVTVVAAAEPEPEPEPGKALTATPVPTVSGTAKVGKSLTAKAGSWKPAKVTLKYQWLRDGQPIAKATKSSYKLVKADAGRKITVQVTGSKSGYASVTKTSKAKSVAKVKAKAKLSVPSKVGKGKKATVLVTVSAATSKPTGTVTVTVNGKKVKATLTAEQSGKVSIKLPAIKKKGNYKVKASFSPSGATKTSTTTSSMVSKTLKVR